MDTYVRTYVRSVRTLAHWPACPSCPRYYLHPWKHWLRAKQRAILKQPARYRRRNARRASRFAAFAARTRLLRPCIIISVRAASNNKASVVFLFVITCLHCDRARLRFFRHEGRVRARTSGSPIFPYFFFVLARFPPVPTAETSTPVWTTFTAIFARNLYYARN